MTLILAGWVFLAGLCLCRCALFGLFCRRLIGVVVYFWSAISDCINTIKYCINLAKLQFYIVVFGQDSRRDFALFSWYICASLKIETDGDCCFPKNALYL